jgi:hypothetical protein
MDGLSADPRVLQDRRLDGSFVPPREIRQLRQLLRHRIALFVITQT